MTNNNNAQHKLNGGTPHTLEQRIALTLADSTADARQLADMVTATEAGIADADTIARRLQEVALDPVCSARRETSPRDRRACSAHCQKTSRTCCRVCSSNISN